MDRTTPELFIANDILERFKPLVNFCSFLDHSLILTFLSGSSVT